MPLFLGVVQIEVTVETGAAVSSYQSHLRAGDQAGRVQLGDLLSALGLMSGFSGFMAVFVVVSTFAFVVSSRRRELGLLRLIGATPRQTRRMIMGESLLVALAAGLTGCLLAHTVEPAVLWLIAERGLTPERLHSPALWRTVAIALPIGTGVALLGARAASRRAARIPPIVATRESSVDARRLGFWRIAFGLLFLAGAVAMLIGIGAMTGEFSLIIGLFAPEMFVIALVWLGPAVFPRLVRLIVRPFLLTGRVSFALARDNVAASGKRTASLAAPILAISAIAGSMIVTLGIAAEWYTATTRARLKAPVVVESNNDPTASAVLGRSTVVATADGEVPFQIFRHSADERPEPEDAEAVDVGAAIKARGLTASRGSLNDLHGNTVAISRSYLFDSGYRFGQRARVSLPDGTEVTLRLVAIVDDATTLHADILVPATLARAHAPHARAERWFVVPRGGSQQAVQTLNHQLGTARAELASTWIADRARDQHRANTLSLWIVLGPASLYSALAIANTLLMGSLQRRRECVATRLIGATESQVRQMILAEALLVTLAALSLGGATTFVVGLLIRRSLGQGLASLPITIPWTSESEIAVICLAIATVAALGPTFFILRKVHPSEATIE